MGMHVVPLRWLAIFGVAVEAAGIEDDFARLGEERLRPHAFIQNVRKLGRRPERYGLCHRVRGHGSNGDRR
jgi:hypothetical protein